MLGNSEVLFCSWVIKLRACSRLAYGGSKAFNPAFSRSETDSVEPSMFGRRVVIDYRCAERRYSSVKIHLSACCERQFEAFKRSVSNLRPESSAVCGWCNTVRVYHHCNTESFATSVVSALSVDVATFQCQLPPKLFNLNIYIAAMIKQRGAGVSDNSRHSVRTRTYDSRLGLPVEQSVIANSQP